MKTFAQQSMTQTERNAFALSLRAVVLSRVAGMCAVTVNVIKRRVAKLSKHLSRFIGFNWKRSISIRGASLLVANG
ncbi:MAG: hypothetical protein ACXWIN_07575 [Burkholderiaceae bacterium]